MNTSDNNSLSMQHSKATRLLLEWYDTNARILAWRMGPNLTAVSPDCDPYHIWLSEIMLQQTQVKTVQGYFKKFIHLWPTLNELADADIEAVLKAWAGLGYYSRARNLHKCARIICRDYDGILPSCVAELKKLPGIGDYTCAAIGAIAFGKVVAVVDGNVERVISRLHLVKEPIEKAKGHIKALTQDLVSKKRPGDFAQAMMDLGATICTPKTPTCSLCPWQEFCQANQRGIQSQLPVKRVKKANETRRGAAFVVISSEGKILLTKRGEKGMLAGMSEVPSTRWSAKNDGSTRIEAAPIRAIWQYAGNVQHSFTHFKLELTVYYCRLNASAITQLPIKFGGQFSYLNERENSWWIERQNVMDEALPNLMKKALQLVFDTLKDAKHE